MALMSRWLVIALMLVSVSTAARAEWLEASTKHFVVYGTLPKKRLTAFTERLERFGAAVRLLLSLPEPEGGSANRVTIYVVSDTAAVQRFLKGDRGSVAGFYRTDAAGSLIVTPLSIEEGNANFTAELVLFHEYAHHLLLGNSATLYPGWVSEGMAELLATAIVSADGGVTFGPALNTRADSILQDNPMTVAALLDSDGRKLDEDEIEQKYGRGWLVSHFLLLGNKRPGQFSTYLRLIAEGMPSAKAGAEAFGDLRKLNAEVNAYRLKRLSGVRINGDKITPDPVTVRQLSAEDAAIMPLRFQSAIGVDDERAAKLVAPARTIAAAYPANAWVQRTMAEIEFDAGNLNEADGWGGGGRWTPCRPSRHCGATRAAGSLKPIGSNPIMPSPSSCFLKAMCARARCRDTARLRACCGRLSWRRRIMMCACSPLARCLKKAIWQRRGACWPRLPLIRTSRATTRRAR